MALIESSLPLVTLPPWVTGDQMCSLAFSNTAAASRLSPSVTTVVLW